MKKVGQHMERHKRVGTTKTRAFPHVFGHVREVRLGVGGFVQCPLGARPCPTLNTVSDNRIAVRINCGPAVCLRLIQPDDALTYKFKMMLLQCTPADTVIVVVRFAPVLDAP